MESVALNNDLSMPALGLGVYLVTDVRECERSVDLALRAGYRLIDTAAIYGNERATGRGMRSSGVAREEIFLTTKIWPSQFGYERTTAAITESLGRLGTPYIDLLLLHQPFGDYLGSWKALEEAVANGSVRSIGVSNFRVHELEELLAVASIPPAVNQVERHPYFQQKDLGTFLAGHQIVPEAWFPIGHGSAKLLGEAVFTELAVKYGKSPVQVVLRWHLQTGWVAIPKSTNPAHIAQNIDIVDFELTSEEMARIAAMDRDRPIFRVPRWLLGLAARFAPIRDLP